MVEKRWYNIDVGINEVEKQEKGAWKRSTTLTEWGNTGDRGRNGTKRIG